MQRARDEVRAQLSHCRPQPAGGITGEAPGPARGSDRLYRVVQYYDSWPFHHDSRVRRGSKSRRRTDTFRTLGPIRDRLARASGYAPVPALLTLAAEVPAAILAKTLGIHVQVAIQWQKISAGDWTAYAADISRRGHVQGPG
ncbi:MAG TPA: hypothetical protein VFX25_29830 [Streptosporangiaceae bacterium]|nr:hypothetical protein [Streptosporangiaceae bacterium]